MPRPDTPPRARPRRSSPAPEPPEPADLGLFAQAPPGLEGQVLDELRALGLAGEIPSGGGGVAFRGGLPAIMAANLHLRVASRVLLDLGSFGARALGELERKAASLSWDAVHRAMGAGKAGGHGDGPGLAAGDGPRAGGGPTAGGGAATGVARVRFRVSASRSRLYHEGAIEERLRRAAGLPETPGVSADEARRTGANDRGTDAHGGDHPEAESRGTHRTLNDILVVVRVHRDRVTARLDTSGEHLHRRGYRLHVGAAPLRETLAAALLRALPFDPDTPFLDPFCGSGTVAIEAALLARGIPPGLATVDADGVRRPRDFAFLHWPGVDRAAWEEQIAEALAGLRPRAPAPLVAADRDAGVLEAARANAGRAGVLEDLQFLEAPFSAAAAASRSGPLQVVTNPPFGTRLGERRRLRPLYTALGRAWGEGAPLEGAALLFLSADPVLEAATGLPLEPRFSTTHGGLRVRGMTRIRREDEGAASPEAPPEAREAQPGAPRD